MIRFHLIHSNAIECNLDTMIIVITLPLDLIILSLIAMKSTLLTFPWLYAMIAA